MESNAKCIGTVILLEYCYFLCIRHSNKDGLNMHYTQICASANITDYDQIYSTVQMNIQ